MIKQQHWLCAHMLPGYDLSPTDQQIINPDLGRSSTGNLAVHAVLIPTTTKVLLWGRIQPAYEPGMVVSESPCLAHTWTHTHTAPHIHRLFLTTALAARRWRPSCVVSVRLCCWHLCQDADDLGTLLLR